MLVHIIFNHIINMLLFLLDHFYRVLSHRGSLLYNSFVTWCAFYRILIVRGCNRVVSFNIHNLPENVQIWAELNY